VLTKIGELARALAHRRRALALWEALAAADPTSAARRADLAASHDDLGWTLTRAGDPEGALPSHRRALAILEPLAKGDASNAVLGAQLGHNYFNLGRAHAALASARKTPESRRLSLWRQAREWFQRSLEIWRALKALGRLTAYDAPTLEKTARELARCEKALARFKTGRAR
jgi:tetratricopeptide (TPR) repeat protein